MPDTSLAASGIRIRPAEPADIATVVDFRARMFREMGWSDESRLEQVAPLASGYLHEQFESGGCTGFVAELAADADGWAATGGVIATVVVVWQSVPPGPRNLPGRQAYILGMYVVPEFRRRGIARALMTAAIECATAGGVPLVTLHASDEGRILYQQLGFVTAPEMRLFTEHAAPPSWVPAYEAD